MGRRPLVDRRDDGSRSAWLRPGCTGSESTSRARRAPSGRPRRRSRGRGTAAAPAPASGSRRRSRCRARAARRRARRGPRARAPCTGARHATVSGAGAGGRMTPRRFRREVGGVAAAPAVELRQLRQLRQRERGRDVRQAVVDSPARRCCSARVSPCERRRRIFAASSRSSVVSMPPSPDVMFFVA